MDSDTASRVCHDNVKIGKDETAMIFNDLDGSLTGKAGATLVSTDSYLLNGLNCNFKDNWNRMDGTLVIISLVGKSCSQNQDGTGE